MDGARNRFSQIATAAAPDLGRRGPPLRQPGGSPAIALALGAVLALTLGNPWLSTTSDLARWLLQGSVVGLGFGIHLAAVLAAGASGIGYTLAGIGLALGLGALLGRLLKVDRETSWLISVGTAICGGSAIAAVGLAIQPAASRCRLRSLPSFC